MTQLGFLVVDDIQKLITKVTMSLPKKGGTFPVNAFIT